MAVFLSKVQKLTMLAFFLSASFAAKAQSEPTCVPDNPEYDGSLLPIAFTTDIVALMEDLDGELSECTDLRPFKKGTNFLVLREATRTVDGETQKLYRVVVRSRTRGVIEGWFMEDQVVVLYDDKRFFDMPQSKSSQCTPTVVGKDFTRSEPVPGGGVGAWFVACTGVSYLHSIIGSGYFEDLSFAKNVAEKDCRYEGGIPLYTIIVCPSPSGVFAHPTSMSRDEAADAYHIWGVCRNWEQLSLQSAIQSAISLCEERSGCPCKLHSDP